MQINTKKNRVLIARDVFHDRFHDAQERKENANKGPSLT